MDSNDKHKAKALDPNSVTVDGDSKTTIDRAGQFLKAIVSIFVTEIGIQIDFNEMQPAKTRTGIISTRDGDSKVTSSTTMFCGCDGMIFVVDAGIQMSAAVRGKMNVICSVPQKAN
jgi:hypothetical protein